MKKVKGIVLKETASYVVLLTGEGDYVKAPRPVGKIRPGREIECLLPGKKKRRLSYAFIAAAVLFLFAFIPQLLPLVQESGHSYLVIDINPSVELAFNREMEVTEANPLNEAGKEILAGFSLGEDLLDSLDYLLVQSRELGYLQSEENLVMLTLVDNAQSGLEEARLGERVEESFAALDIKGYVSINKADEDKRQESFKEGLSINKYIVREEIRSTGDVKDYQLPDTPLLQVVKERAPWINERLIPLRQGSSETKSPEEGGGEIPGEGKAPQRGSEAGERPGEDNQKEGRPGVNPPKRGGQEETSETNSPSGEDGRDEIKGEEEGNQHIEQGEDPVEEVKDDPSGHARQNIQGREN